MMNLALPEYWLLLLVAVGWLACLSGIVMGAVAALSGCALGAYFVFITRRDPSEITLPTWLQPTTKTDQPINLGEDPETEEIAPEINEELLRINQGLTARMNGPMAEDDHD